MVDRSAHNAAMIAAADASGVQIRSGTPQPGSNPTAPDVAAAPAAKHERPSYVPEKFFNAETGVVNVQGMAEAYAKLESGRGKPAEAEADTAEAAPTDPAAALPSSVVSKAQQEFETDGKLSDATYEALIAQGVDRETVDAYVRGVEATRTLAFEIAGGEDEYGAMLAWAGDNLSADEQAAFNESINGRPAELAKAIRDLSKQYKAQRSVEPKMLEGTLQVNSVTGFNSKAEMTAAMRDPRYKTDAAFRRSVSDKIASTSSRVSLFQ